jgi:hypothetical protein
MGRLGISIKYMIRIIILSLLFSVCSVCKAENYIISYRGYLGDSLVILKVSINGTKAVVDGENYVVAKNNEVGIVLVQSFAQESTVEQPYLGALGVFCIILDKKTNKVTRGNVLAGELKNPISTGSFVLDQ